MELADYEGIIFGCGTRYGVMASQMRNFIDQTGSLWVRGALVGKVGSAFSSTASQHGGQETTLLSHYAGLLHLGMVVVGLPYSFSGLTEMGELTGGTPYGATHVSGIANDRPVTDDESKLAFALGQRLALVAQKLSA